MYLFNNDESYTLEQICAKLNGFTERSCKSWINRWRIKHSIVNNVWCVPGRYLNESLANGPPPEDPDDPSHERG